MPSRSLIALACAVGLALVPLACRRERKGAPPASSSTRAAPPAPPRPPGPAHRLLASASVRGITLVAWRDRGIRAVRLDGNGKLLDPRPIVVSSDPKDGDVAAAAHDGGFWLVWEHFRQSPGVSVQGVRIARDGQLLDARPRALTGPDGTQRSPRVACGPARCLLSFHDHREGSYGTLHSRLLGGDGVLSPAVAHPGQSHQDGDVSRAGDGFLSVFGGGLDPKLDTVSALRLGGEPRRIHETRFNSGMRVACGAKRCYAAWLHGEEVVGGPRHRDLDGARVYVTPTRSQIWGAALELDGSMAPGASPKRLRDLDTGLARMELLALAAGESDFFLSWEATAFELDGKSSAGVLRIKPDGTTEELPLPGPERRTASAEEGWPAVLLSGDRIAAVRSTAGGAVEWAVQAMPK